MIDSAKEINLPLTDDDWEFIAKVDPDMQRNNMFSAPDWLDLVHRMYMYGVKNPEYSEISKRMHLKGAVAINKEWGIL